MKRALFWSSGSGACLSALALLGCWLAPGWLEPVRVAATRVAPKFKTAAEREELKAQSEILGESAYSLSYDEYETAESYLPPRGSLRHRVLGVLGMFLRLDKPVASREDLLPDAPDGRKLIDATTAYPLQARAANFLFSWFRIGFGALALALGALALLLKKFRFAAKDVEHSENAKKAGN